MGYTTDFFGYFQLDKPLDKKTELLLKGLSETRRMKRSISALAKLKEITIDEAIKKWGHHGEFYFDFKDMGQTRDSSIIDFNSPPPVQPDLWCNWKYQKDTYRLVWDKSEKFYHYVEWMIYIINIILIPNGYVINGTILWQGQDFFHDQGLIEIITNVVTVKRFDLPFPRNSYSHERSNGRQDDSIPEIIIKVTDEIKKTFPTANWVEQFPHDDDDDDENNRNILENNK